MNIYLASPYTHESKIIMEGRYYAALDAAAALIQAGHNVFSPIVHSHHIGKVLGNGSDSAFWTNLDLSFIDRWADAIAVLCIPGWWRSAGIMREMDVADIIGIPIVYVPCLPHHFGRLFWWGTQTKTMEKARFGHMWE